LAIRKLPAAKCPRAYGPKPTRSKMAAFEVMIPGGV